MSMIKTLLVAGGLASFVAVGAFAQQPMPKTPGGIEGPQTNADIDDDMAVYINPQGRMMRKKVNAKHRDALMKHARELPTGSVLYRSKGKVYIINNDKMSNGKTPMENFDRLDEETY